MNAWVIIAPTKIKNREKQNVEMSNSNGMKTHNKAVICNHFQIKEQIHFLISFHFDTIHKWVDQVKNQNQSEYRKSQKRLKNTHIYLHDTHDTQQRSEKISEYYLL